MLYIIYVYIAMRVPCAMLPSFLISEKTVVRLVPVQALNMATVQLYGAEGMRHQAFSVVLRGMYTCIVVPQHTKCTYVCMYVCLLKTHKLCMGLLTFSLRVF